MGLPVRWMGVLESLRSSASDVDAEMDEETSQNRYNQANDLYIV